MRKLLCCALAVVLLMPVLSLSVLAEPNNAAAPGTIAADVPYFATAPTIDGNVNNAEWGEPLLRVGRNVPNVNSYPRR